MQTEPRAFPGDTAAGITRSAFAPFALLSVLGSTLCWVGLILGSASALDGRLSPWALLARP